jgi:hypothetical protein
MPNILLLLIEFLDELIFGVTDAAWPLIRTDLHLNYIQIGLALSLPGIIGSLIEPFLGILGDVWKRRVLILGGGLFFAAACLLTAVRKHAMVKKTPPPRISTRRFQASPRMPRKGSIRLPMIPGRLRARPIWA